MRSLPIILLSLLTSCATIVSSSTFHVPIDSVPPGATVSYQEANVGVTPCTVVMRRQCSQVTLTLPNHHVQVVEVGRGSNAWILGNLVFGGLVGVVVDSASGATGTISTDPCWVELTPSGDVRPSVWVRPRGPDFEPREEDGWVQEGGTAVARATPTEQPKPRPTRAAPWMPASGQPSTVPYFRAGPPPDDGWVRHGRGN